MKKLLLLVFTATLVLFFTPASYAQRSSSVKVANNAELIKALNNPNVKSMEITQGGFYDELLLNANEGTFVFKGNGSRGTCQYWINTHNVCFDGDTTTNVAASGVTSTGGATCPGVDEGYWTVVSQPAGSNVTFQSAVNKDTMYFYVDQPGVYELKNSWYQTPGDPTTTLLGSAQTQYTFYSEPVITQLDASPDSVCGLSTTINFNYDVGTYHTGDTTVTWMVNGADSSAVYPKVPGSFTFTVPTCGTYTLNLHVTNSLGCGNADSTITIYFYDEPVVDADTNTAMGDTVSVCGLTYGFAPSYTIQCDNGTTTATSWSGTGTWTNDSVTVASCGTYKYYYTVVNGPCSTTDSIVVKFYDTPNVTANVNADTVEICGLSALLLPDVTVACTNGSTVDSVWSGTGLQFVGDSVFATTCGTYTAYLDITVGPCTNRDSVVIKFFDTPDISSPTTDTVEICGLTTFFSPSFTVACDNGSTPTASWSGTGLTFNGDTVTVAACGTYMAYYTVTNGPCTAIDSVLVKFYDTPVVDADTNTAMGDTVSVCGLTYGFVPDYTIQCDNGTTTTTSWTGTGTWSNDTVTVTSCGVYKYYYTVVNGPCSTTDSIVVKFYDTPNVTANVNADTVEICGLSTLLFPEVSVTCTNGSTVDSVWSGTGLTFVGDSVFATTCGTYTAYLDVTVGPCTNRDSVVIKFFDTPVVNAGTGDTLCSLTGSLAGSHTEACTNGSTPTVQWTKVSGPGHVVFTPGSADQDNVSYEVDECGAYTFRYTVTNGPCVDSADVSYYRTDTPVATIDMASDTVCGFDSYVTAFYTANCAVGDTAWMTWSSGSTVDSIVYDPGATIDNYHIYVSSCGTDTITYHVTNGPCTTDTTFYVTYFETPAPTINGDTAVYSCSTTTYYPSDPGCNDPAGIRFTWNVVGGVFSNGYSADTTTGNASVSVNWDNNFGTTAYITVHAEVMGVTGCGGDDSLGIDKLQPTLEGQVKYWNDVETYMPTPFSTNNYSTYPFDYFYVTLYRVDGTMLDSLATAYVQPRLMEDLNELMSYFEFDINTGQYGCEAGYKLKVWDGGFIYHNNPPAPSENTILGNNYTWNNWGGVNATDALAIQLMAANVQISGTPYNYAWVGDNTWTPTFGYYSFGVADVNQTTAITALDALTAKYRAVGLLGSYPDNGSSNQFAPNFMVTGRMVDSLPEITFPTPFNVTNPDDVPFTHSGTEYMYFQPAVNHKYTSDSIPWKGAKNYINLYYESVGDVNASYIPPGSGLKSQPNMELIYSGLATTQVGEEMTIPVSVDRSVEAGAITLSFNYRNDLIEVLGTNFSDDDMLINQKDGVLNIAWFNTTPLELNENATIAQIRVRVLAEIPAGTELFSLNAITEIADANATPISNVNLKTIGVTTEKGIINGTGLTTSNYPNPFDNATTISYTLPENGKVKVDVYNSVGMLITTLVDEYQESGVQNAVFTSGNVKAGVYFYHITVQGETNNYSAVKRMIVVH